MNIYNPIYIEECFIYDVFYNDENKYVLIGPMLNNYKLNIKINNIIYELKQISCHQRHTYVYISEKLNYYSNIDIIINDNQIINIKVNQYPNLSGKILMSTIVKDEDNYICQWIEYHKFMGIDNFIIYDNSNKNTLSETLDKYIKDNTVILINWQYPYIYLHSGISGQTTQQNHSIYSFKNAKYIGLMDIDEYLNPQIQQKKINDIFDEVIKTNNININNVGGFELVSKLFYNHDKKPENEYEFLKIIKCSDFCLTTRQKVFVIPKNVDIFSVHMIVSGKPKITIPTKILYFNHYMFLNKTDRGREKSDLLDLSMIKNIVEFNKYIQVYRKVLNLSPP
jgi:hypothetical protein